jgi:8-oxo-dGTP pyrophosphatase MutT (NUDIX family)
VTPNIAHLSAEAIAHCLASCQEPPLEDAYPSALLSDAPRPAAVLVPLLRQPVAEPPGWAWHILFTRRTANLAEHSGQVAFPGGRSDPEDRSPEATALREAQEEVGLTPHDVHILGCLGSFPTITNYLVTPVVGFIPWPYPLRPEPTEVSRIFTIPLAWLADPQNHTVGLRTLPGCYTPVPVIYFEIFDGEKLWGISAQIVVTLLQVLRHAGR